MKLISSVLLICLFLFSGYGYAEKKVESYTGGLQQLEELVGKIALIEQSYSKEVGVVTEIDKAYVTMKRCKEKWVKDYVKANKKDGIKNSSRKGEAYSIPFPEVKIYILEEGKEPELFMNGMDLLVKMNFRYYVLDKVKVSGQEHQIEKNSSTFEDDKIKITWNQEFDSLNAMNQFRFEMRNKTSDTIKLIWDESTFVDSKSEVHKIFHSGIKYIERNNPLSPSIIPGETKFTDIIIPTDYVYFSSDWYTNPIYKTWVKDKANIPEKPETMRVILTLQVGEEKLGYNFYFKGEIKPLEAWPKELWKDICNRMED